MKFPAVFFDRDGTLNYDPGYLGDPDIVKLFPGVPQGIADLKNKCNFKIIVISNQSGISRGLITKEDVDKVNSRINEILRSDNTKIDEFYYCPYHPDYDPIELCKCRKPSPDMIFKAAEEHDIDLTKSFFVGNTLTDVECGANAGLTTVLILSSETEDEINTLKKGEISPNFTAENFSEACNFIMNKFFGDISEN